MKTVRLHVLLMAIALPSALPAQAQTYPAKPIRVMVPYAPGSTTDTLARFVSQHLTEQWGQAVVVDNRAGAGGNIATELVAHAAPDGYTLLVTAANHSISPALNSKLGYDAIKDFTPITLFATAPQLIVVHPGVAANSLRELIALAKTKPGQLRYASSGSGSPSHLAMELFCSMAGIQLVHVPYKGGGSVLNAVLSGEIHLYPGNILAMMSLVRAGKLRALGVTSPQRSPAAADIPTVAEAGVPGYGVLVWWGALAPAHTPKTIIDQLNAAISSGLKNPRQRERLAADGIEVVAGTPAEFAAHIQRELAMWTRVVKTAGIRAE